MAHGQQQFQTNELWKLHRDCGYFQPVVYMISSDAGVHFKRLFLHSASRLNFSLAMKAYLGYGQSVIEIGCAAISTICIIFIHESAEFAQFVKYLNMKISQYTVL